MGLQGRYFGRWLLPIFPILCLLAAYFVVQLAGAAARLRRAGERCAWALAALLVAALLAQGAHLQRPRRARALARRHAHLTRTWMLAHVPAGAGSSPSPSRRRNGRAKARRSATVPDPYRWQLYRLAVPAHHCRRRHRTGLHPRSRTRGLRDARSYPALIDFYERERLLLGDHRLDRVRARVRRPAGGATGDRLLQGAGRAGRSRLPRLAIRRGQGGRDPSRSTSTGASTTTRWPTTGPGPR